MTAQVQIDYRSAGTGLVHAGFWLRWVAWLIDWLVLLAIRFAVLSVVGLLAMGIEAANLETEAVATVGGLIALGLLYLCAWPYYALMEAFAGGATLGKKALGLQVIDIDGETPTFAQTSVRFFLRIVSAALLGIGFLMIAFTGKRQALHDIAANCLVVVKPRHGVGMVGHLPPTRGG